MVISSGVSGGHLNPAVSVALASLGKLPWRKVSQNLSLLNKWQFYLGSALPRWPIPWSFHCILHCLPCLLGWSCLVWAWPGCLPLYSWNCRNLFDLPLTPSLLYRWYWWPVSWYFPPPCLYLCRQRQQKHAGKCLRLSFEYYASHIQEENQLIRVPLVTGCSVLGLWISLGYNCGYAVNPARDLAPRVFSGKGLST